MSPHGRRQTDTHAKRGTITTDRAVDVDDDDDDTGCLYRPMY